MLIVSGRGLVYLQYSKEGLISDLERRLNGTLISMRFLPEPIKSINMDLEKCIDIESYNIKKINL